MLHYYYMGYLSCGKTISKEGREGVGGLGVSAVNTFLLSADTLNIPNPLFEKKNGMGEGRNVLEA